MGQKNCKIVGKVLPELGSKRTMAQMKDLKKLNSRYVKDEFWK